MKIVTGTINDKTQYGTSALAEALGVSRQTVYRWVEANVLKPRFRRSGSKRMFFIGADVLRNLNRL